MKTLIASHCPKSLELLLSKCSELSIQPTIIDSCVELLSNWKQFDLILIGEKLKDTSGLEACTQLRKLETENPPPLLLIADDDDFMALHTIATLGGIEAFGLEEQNKIKNYIAKNLEQKAALAGLEGKVLYWNNPSHSESIEDALTELGLKCFNEEDLNHSTESHSGLDLLIVHGFDSQLQETLKLIQNLKTFQNPYQELPILWLTDKHDHLQRSQILQAGVNDVLTLPLANVELASRLGVHLRAQSLLRQVEQQSKKFKSMFDSLTLGVFEFTHEYKINDSYSKVLEELLDTPNICDFNFKQLLLDNSNWTQEEKDRLENCLSICWGLDLLNWELNSDELPHTMVRKTSSGIKEFEIEWVPLEEEEALQKVMVILKDVTEINQLKKEQELKNKDQEVLAACLDIDLPSIQGFISNSQNYRVKWDLVITSSSSQELRDLHTLKGNARTLQLKSIAALIHQIESLVQANDSSGIMKCIEEWEDWELRSQKLLNRLKSLANPDKGSQNSKLSSIVQKNFSLLLPIAQERGFEGPRLLMECDDYTLPAHQHELLNSALQHLFTNSLAHGFLNKAERQQQQLLPYNTLSVSSQIKDSNIEIFIQDDGKGLNLNRLKEIAASKGQNDLNDQELAQQI
ncbi:Hpt domain-containing protein, partial [bacterium]|nr:Hpt domain-containing protein [bacterium]